MSFWLNMHLTNDYNFDPLIQFLKNNSISDIRLFAQINPKEAERYSEKALNILKELNTANGNTEFEDLKIKSWVLASQTPIPNLTAHLSKVDVKKLSHDVKQDLIKNISHQTGTSEECEKIFTSLLIDAIKENNLAEVKSLIEKGAVLSGTKNGSTPLHYALKSRPVSLGIIEFLLSCSPPPPLEAKDDNGYTPLHHAVLSRSIHAIDLLLQSGANLEAEDECGDTPLNHAILSIDPSYDIVSFLLDRGASLTHRNLERETPLHQAVLAGKKSLPIIDLLIRKGASLHAKAKGDSVLLSAVKAGCSSEIIDLLLKRGAHNYTKDDYENNPLHYAVRPRKASPAVVDVLLAGGVPLNGKNKRGETPLHEALRWKSSPASIEFIDYLISKGASLTVANIFGDTPLHTALESQQTPAIINLLLERGADLDTFNSFGETCAFLAESQGLAIPQVSKKQSYNEEFAHRFLLANHWGIEHTSELGGLKFALTQELYSPIGVRHTLSLLKKFAQFPFQEEFLQDFADRYVHSFFNTQEPASTIQQKFQAGESFSFLTQTEEQPLSVIFHKDYMMVTNASDKKNPIKMFKIDRTKYLSDSAILTLQGKVVLDESEGVEFFYKELPEMLGSSAQNQDTVVRTMNKMALTIPENAKNRWWTAPREGIYTFFALEECLKGQEEGLPSKERSFLSERAQTFYNQFSEFALVETCKEYMGRPASDQPRDYSLIEKVVKELNTKEWETISEQKTNPLSLNYWTERVFGGTPRSPHLLTKEKINEDVLAFCKADPVFQSLQNSSLLDIQAFASSNPEEAKKYAKQALAILKVVQSTTTNQNFEDLKIKMGILAQDDSPEIQTLVYSTDLSRVSLDIKNELINLLEASKTGNFKIGQSIFNFLLFNAIEKRDVNDLGYLAAFGISPSAKKDGNSPLHLALAALPPSIEIIEILLEGGASLRVTDKDGNTPLHTAILSDAPLDVVKHLLRYRPPMEAHESGYGETPLHTAILAPHPSPAMIELLLQNGAPLDAKDKEGQTPLHAAIRSHCPYMIIERLLDKGAPGNAIDKNGQTPLQLAIENYSSPAVIRLLIEHCGALEASNDKGYTPLHTAILTGASPALLKLLLQGGASLSAQDKDGQTPLHLAILTHASPQVVSCLLEKGQALELENKNANTPLHEAVIAGSTEIVRLLLDKGADFRAKDSKLGRTALHKAMHSTPSVINLLLERGADPDEMSNNGETFNYYVEAFGRADLGMHSQKQDYISEFKYRHLLAQSWSVRHTTEIEGKTIKLEGGFHEVAARHTLAMFKDFINHPSQTPGLHKFLDLYEKSTLNTKPGPFSELQKKFSQGESFSFMTGWHKHSISVTFHKDYMIVANRGQNRQPESLKVFKIDRSKPLSKEAFLVLNGYKVLDANEGADFFYRKLPEILGSDANKPDAVADLINKECRQVNQKIGNCWWITPKAGMFALLALDSILETRERSFFDESASNTSYSEQFTYAQNVYKQFSEFTRIKLLEEYIERPSGKISKDYDLVEKIKEKLNAKKWKHIFEERVKPSSPEELSEFSLESATIPAFFDKDKINMKIAEFLNRKPS